MISIETKDHIKKLASDYKCWSATITYHEALELCEMIEDIEALNAINLDLASENEDLVERIGKLIGYIDFLRNTAQGKKESLNLLEKVVKGELEEIRAEGENFVKPKTGEWIPVTEDVPPIRTICLCCNKQGRVFTSEITYRSERSSYVGKHGYFSNGLENYGDIVAWMPLPQPYKAESEDKE